MIAALQSLNGLRSKNEENRLQTAIQLQHYINTEMRELTAEQTSNFIEQLYQYIYDLMSNSDTNEKKGGLLAIVSQISLDEGSHVRLSRAANFLRNMLPENESVILEMSAQTLGCLAAASGNQRTEYLEFQLKRAIEWISGQRNEMKRLSAVFIFREVAISAPTIFYFHIHHFFDDIFNVARDPKPSVREAAVSALRAALQLTVHRETKDSEQKPHWFKQTFDEAMLGFSDVRDKSAGSSKDDRIHASLLILNELVRIGTKQSQIPLEEAMKRVTRLQFPQKKTVKSFARLPISSSRMQHCAPQTTSSLLLSSSRPSPGSQSIAKLAALFGEYCSGSSKSLSASNPLRRIVDNDTAMESISCKNLINDDFTGICSKVLECKTSRSPHIQLATLSLLPRLAASNPEEFAENHLDEAMTYILGCLKKDRDKANGYYAIGLLFLSLKKSMSLYMPKVFNHIKLTLPNKDMSAKKQRNFVIDPAIFACISMMVTADSESVALYLDDALLNSMLTIGVSPSLMVALHDLSLAIPLFKKTIYNGIVKVLSLIILNRSASSTNVNTTVVLPHTVDPSNTTNLLIALKTLSMFHFYELDRKQNIWQRTPSQLIMSFAEECSSPRFTCHENVEVRVEAIRTVVTILRPYIPYNVVTSTGVTLYPNLIESISKVVKDVLHLAITDKDSDVRVEILCLLGVRFDCYLCQPEMLSALFIANHDEVFEVREAAVCIMGRLAEHNPAYVMPFLRKTLIELLAELQHSGIGKNQMQSTRLLGQLACTAPLLIRPYVHTIMQALIMELKEHHDNPPVSVGIMQTIGEFAEVGGSGIGVSSVIDELMPVILQMLQAHSNYAKREVALITLGKLVSSTGYVVEPYEKYPKLLDTLLGFLKTEQSLLFRKEVVKVLGLIGALDPFRHKTNQSEHNVADGMTVPERKEIDADSGSSTSDILIALGSSSEDFYLAVAVTMLMRVLKDSLLSAHHMDVIQAIDYMFSTLGIKCVPYLPQIVPTYLATIRSCDSNNSNIREFLFKNLGSIVLTVKQHARKFMNEIFNLIREYWTVGSSLQGTLISLCEQIAQALAGEFRAFLPLIVSNALKVFIHDDSSGKNATLKMLQALQVFSTNLDAFIHLFLPPVIKLLDSSDELVPVRKAALATLQKWSECLDLRDYMSQIMLPLIRVISSAPDLRTSCMDLLTSLIKQFGTSYYVYIPMVNNLIEKYKILHPGYDTMVTKVKLAQEGLSKSSFFWPGETQNQEDNANSMGVGEVSSAKKPHISTQNLQKAWNNLRRVAKDNWYEWLRRLSVEFLKESPSSALKACGALANSYHPLSRALFNAAFLSCWTELSESQQDELVDIIENALRSPDIPAEVTHTLLNLAEFMEHTDKGPLPLRDGNGMKLLGETATKCRAFAKALHYKELEFHKCSDTTVIGDLININSKLGQSDAADGVLLFHEKSTTAATSASLVADDSISSREGSRIFAGSNAIEMTWYERLHKWEEAKQSYWVSLQYAAPGDPKKQKEDHKLGYMRCLEALGQWEELHSFVEQEWSLDPNASYQRKMAKLAVAASWGLGKWESMDEYTCMIPREQYDGPFYRAVMAIHQDHFVQAKECIEEAREILDSELTSLAGESYNRAYSALVNCQMLAELEEVVCYKRVPERRALIKQAWWDRLQGCEKNLEDWQRIIQVRSLVISPHDDIRSWLKFAGLCVKHGRKGLAEKVLVKLLEVNPSDNPSAPLPTKYPYVSLAYMKFMWKQGQQKEAISQMLQFVNQVKAMPQTLTESQKTELNHLMSRCYLKLGQWQQAMGGLTEEHAQDVSTYFHRVTEHDKSWYKGWHCWAVMNFEYVQFYKRKLDAFTSVKKKDGKKGNQSIPEHQITQQNEDLELDAKHMAMFKDYNARLLQYAVQSVRGFFRSIALSAGNSLQDTLRVLSLWFDYGDKQRIAESVIEGLKTIQIENWLQVIPQLIARIDTPRQLVARPIHQLLSDIGKYHPQALIYPLTVASKSMALPRQKAANAVLAKMCEHSSALVNQAIMVSDELIRVAILWHELWHEGLEEASRLYFGERDVVGMLATLEPLHAQLERGPQTLKEISFNQAYGRDLLEAQDWCRKYAKSNNVKDLNQAWDLYYHVFRRITKQLPQLTSLEMQYVSPKLMICNDLELAVPGTYNPKQNIIKIKSVNPTLQVISSKQRPRKLRMIGSNGKDYTFLLKGHEDLRQDERVMQLFGLVNTLLANDQTSSRKNLSIQRYAVIPLSTNSGLIGWVPHSDTLHALIRDYRERKRVLLNIEHRIMLKMAPDYEHLTPMQKVEVFEHAVNNTAGDDLARLLWLKSPTSEIWFDRRTNYTRSLAVMSMVGHILGLGDRHPSNLMLDRVSGKVLHIDFGDCFEVAMAREKFPEKIPFRLTRMLIKAMEVTGIEGNYRNTCHVVMSVLRQHRESVMTVLEAFVYDPLLNWRLMENIEEGSTHRSDSALPQSENASGNASNMNSGSGGLSQSQGDSRPEVLNKKALNIINRVRDKLTGRDFPSQAPQLDIPDQVELLIRQATSHENLCQCYIGWCPFW